MFICVLLLLDNIHDQMYFALAGQHTCLDVFCSCWIICSDVICSCLITDMLRCVLLLLDNIHV